MKKMVYETFFWSATIIAKACTVYNVYVHQASSALHSQTNFYMRYDAYFRPLVRTFEKHLPWVGSLLSFGPSRRENNL